MAPWEARDPICIDPAYDILLKIRSFTSSRHSTRRLMSQSKHVLWIPGALCVSSLSLARLFSRLGTDPYLALRWGHLRPSLAIITALLPLHPNLLVTLFLPAQFTTITETELGHHDLPTSCRERLRMPRYGKEEAYLAPFDEIPAMLEVAIENIKENLPKLLKVWLDVLCPL